MILDQQELSFLQQKYELNQEFESLPKVFLGDSNKTWDNLTPGERNRLYQYLSQSEETIRFRELLEISPDNLSNLPISIFDPQAVLSIQMPQAQTYVPESTSKNPYLAGIKRTQKFRAQQAFVEAHRLAVEKSYLAAIATSEAFKKKHENKTLTKNDVVQLENQQSEQTKTQFEQNFVRETKSDQPVEDFNKLLQDTTDQVIQNTEKLKTKVNKEDLKNDINSTIVDPHNQDDLFGYFLSAELHIENQDIEQRAQEIINERNIDILTEPAAALNAYFEATETQFQILEQKTGDELLGIPQSRLDEIRHTTNTAQALLPNNSEVLQQLIDKTIEKSPSLLENHPPSPNTITPRELLAIDQALSKMPFNETQPLTTTLRANFETGARTVLNNTARGQRIIESLDQPTTSSTRIYESLAKRHSLKNLDSFITNNEPSSRHISSEVNPGSAFRQLSNVHSYIKNFESTTQTAFFKADRLTRALRDTPIGQTLSPIIKAPRDIRNKITQQAGNVLKNSMGNLLSDSTKAALSKFTNLISKEALAKAGTALAAKFGISAALGFSTGGIYLVIQGAALVAKKGLNMVWRTIFGRDFDVRDAIATGGAILLAPVALASSVLAFAFSRVSVAFISPVLLASIIVGYFFFWIPTINVAPILSTLVQLDSGVRGGNFVGPTGTRPSNRPGADCYEISDAKDVWPDEYANNMQTVVEYISNNYGGFTDKLCTGPIPITYNSRQAYRNGYPYGGELLGDGSITIYPAGIKYDLSSNTYTLAHESGHFFAPRNRDIFNLFNAQNVWGKDGFICTYPLGQTDNEDFAEMIGTYIAGSLASRYNPLRDPSECGKTYPLHLDFANQYIFN